MRKSGLVERMTRQRRIILDEMQTPGRHLSADDVFEIVRKKMPNVSLGTVYRNLEILHKAGWIKKLSMGGGQKQYDGGMHRHYHVRCIECHKVVDVSADAFPDLDAAARLGVDGFDILDHELEFSGICDGCRAKEKK